MVNLKLDKNTPITIIDGDGLSYIIGWSMRDYISLSNEGISKVYEKVDSFMNTIIAETMATHFIGVIEHTPKYDVGTTLKTNFRHRYSVTKQYKGNRPSKPAWHTIWSPVVQRRLIEFWDFYRVDNKYEADDVVAALAFELLKQKFKYISIAGNDKDLHQIPGSHYNYKSAEKLEISLRKAFENLWTQVLLGDSTDNIVGLKGYGAVAVNKFFENELKHVQLSKFPSIVLNEFIKVHGQDKGIKAFTEAYMLVKLRADADVSEYTPIKYNEVRSTEMSADVAAFLNVVEDEEIKASLDNVNFNNLNKDIFDV